VVYGRTSAGGEGGSIGPPTRFCYGRTENDSRSMREARLKTHYFMEFILF